ncbi:MAG: HD-GYP domain-containing protein [Gemmatimonadaceae bacterium]
MLDFKLPTGRASASIASIPLVACAILSPNLISIAAVACTITVGELLKRREIFKLIFNVSQWCFAISIGLLAYLALGGTSLMTEGHLSLLASSQHNFWPFAVLLVVFSVVNSVSVSIAVSLLDQRPAAAIWRKNTASSAGYDILIGPVAYLIAWAFTNYGPVAAAGLAVPLVGFRQLYITNFQLELVNQELLQLMVKAIEARDPYTSGHSLRVSHYSQIVARAIGLSAKDVERVGTAALLHDVGKIHEVYAPILRKPDKLTAEEWAIMKTHPIKSAELVSTVSHLKDIVAPLRHHHENWDGSGYPDGLAGDSIPLASRIIIFADTTDAMTTDRPYRKALSPVEVRAEFIRCRGAQFDPQICDRLLESPLFDLLFAPVNFESATTADRPIKLVRREPLAKPA